MVQTAKYDLFISYAETDRAWVEGYLLDALEQVGLRYHTEAAFALGRVRLQEFERAITESDRTLLVLSPAYLADDFNQFIRLLAQSYGRDTATWPVIPLILQPVQLPPSLNILVSLNATNPQEWKEAIKRLCTDLKRQLPTPPLKPSCPYPGMVPFSEDDSDRFFGRDDEIEELLQSLRLHPFLAVIGSSGSGKSSLVFAGLIPKLPESGLFGGEWLISQMRPGKTPLKNLKTSLGIDLSNPGLAVTENLPQLHSSQRLLLVIDQFEEVFTVAGEEAIPFQETLLSLIKIPNCYVVMTVRADFYPELMSSAMWEQIQAHRLEVVPLKEAGLRQAIVKPCDIVNVFVETALVERLVVDAAGEPGFLPLIQETLVLLWEQLERRFLPLRAYEALILLPRSAYENFGNNKRTGLQVAIARRASSAIANLSPKQQAIARRIFLRLIQFGEGRADTRRQQLVEALITANDDAALFKQTLNHLVNCRLLTLTGAEDTSTKVDIAHEVLITGWGTLQQWITELQEAEQTRRRLETKASEWLRLGKASGGLLDQVELAEAERWLSTSDATDLGYDEALSALIEASKKAIQIAEREEEEQKQRELELIRERLEQEKKALKASRKNNRTLLISLILLSGLTIFAVNQTLQTTLKNLEALSASAETLFALNKQSDALAKTIEAGELLKKTSLFAREDVKIRILTDLNQLIYGFREINSLKEHTAEVRSVNFSPDGQLIASSSNDSTIKIYKSNGKLLQTIKGHIGIVFDAIFNIKNNLLISVSQDKTIKIWERKVNGCFTLKKSFGDENEVVNIAISPDNQTIASDTKGGKIKLWDLNGKLIKTLDAHQGRINNLSFSPNGQMASVGEDKFIKLWNIKKQTLVKSLQDDNFLFAVSFVDEQTLVSANERGIIKIWDLNTGKNKIIGKHDNSVNRLSVSKDRKNLASASDDTTIKIWDIQSFKLLETLKGHVKRVTDVSLSEDNFNSKILASASEDGTIKLWTIILPTTIDGSSFSFSPDSQKIITGNEEGNLRLWSKNGSLIMSFPHSQGSILQVKFSPDGKTIVSSSSEKKVNIWNINGKLRQTIKTNNPVTSISFSPDSQIIATASTDEKTVNIFNLNGKLRKSFIANGKVKSISFSPDGKTIAASNYQKKINVWSLNGTSDQTFVTDVPASSVSFSPDGKTIAGARYDGRVDIWHLDKKRQTPQQFKEFIGSIQDAAFSPHGQAIALAYPNQAVILLNLMNLKNPSYRILEQLIKTDSNDISQISFSPDGTILAYADNKSITLWNFDLDDLLKLASSSYSNYLENKRDNDTKVCK